jgi:hypothetical protein
MNSVTRQPSLCAIAQPACALLPGLATATGAQERTFRAQSNVVTVPVLVERPGETSVLARSTYWAGTGR